MDNQHIHIHFKSLAGDITTIQLDNDLSLNHIQFILSQQLSTPDYVIQPERILFFDPDQDDHTTPPQIIHDHIYSYIVRDEDDLTLRPHMRYDDPITDPITHENYEKYTFQIFDLLAHTSQDPLPSTFSIYYNPSTQRYIPSNFFTESKEQDGFGQPHSRLIDDPNHYPHIFDAILHSLTIPWYDRHDIAQKAYQIWQDNEVNRFEYDPYDRADDDDEYSNRHYELRRYMDAYGPYDHADEF